MKFKTVILTALVLASLSCKKKGCIDRQAKNYDSSAKKESTCYYSARLALWADESTWSPYKNTVLEYYLDEQLMKQAASLQFGNANSDCNSAEVVVLEKDLGTNSSGTMRYKVIEQSTKKILCDSSLQVFGGYCLPQQMILK